MPVATGSSRFRPRKVNFKTHLHILRESDLVEDERDQHHLHGDDNGEDGGDSNVQRFETGVDKDEEKVSLAACDETSVALDDSGGTCVSSDCVERKAAAGPVT